MTRESRNRHDKRTDTTIEVRADTHRGNVCEALSAEEYRDCADVASALERITVGSASSVLSDVYRANYAARRRIQNPEDRSHDARFEYRLHDNISIKRA